MSKQKTEAELDKLSRPMNCHKCGSVSKFARYLADSDAVYYQCGNCQDGLRTVLGTDITAKLEEFIKGDKTETVDADALEEYLKELPGCYKCDFVPASQIGALRNHEGNPIKGLPLCDKHDWMPEKDFIYAESLRRAIQMLVDFNEAPWWLAYHDMKFKAPKQRVEVES